MKKEMKPAFFVPVVLCAVVAVAGSAAPRTAHSPNLEDHQEWVAQSLLEMQTIKVGMTRGDLNKVFVGEGGLFSSASRTYIYRGCPYFKVRVGFKPEGARFSPATGTKFGLEDNPKDKIVSISEPVVNNLSQPN
jgi:hypothetical protein